MILAMIKKPDSQEYKAFENILGTVLGISKADLKRRMEEEKRTTNAPASRAFAVPSKPS